MVERVDVLDDVELVIGTGRFHNLHFFQSIDSLGVIFKMKKIVMKETFTYILKMTPRKSMLLKKWKL